MKKHKATQKDKSFPFVHTAGINGKPQKHNPILWDMAVFCFMMIGLLGLGTVFTLLANYCTYGVWAI